MMRAKVNQGINLNDYNGVWVIGEQRACSCDSWI